MVAAGERFDETGSVSRSVPLHGEGGQLQTSDPTFGALVQRSDVFRLEVQSHHLVEKFNGLCGGET